MIIKYDNIFYVRNINTIGGVETYVYELVKKYKDKDIAVVCKTIAPKQAERLRKYCNVYIHTNQKIECKVIITNWDTSIIDYVNDDAKVYTVLHTDYSHISQQCLPIDNERITYIGITEDSKKKFEDITGIKRTILCRNPLEIEEQEPIVKIMSATRLTNEKGGYRMLQLANKLDELGVNYIWYIFTTDEYKDNPVWNNKNIIRMKNRLDLGYFFDNADWYVQLSEVEGDSYSLKEALYRGTPIVVLELPYFKEIGIKDNVNALFLNKDLSNLEEVANKIKMPLKFTFKPIEDEYYKILTDSKSHYKEDLKMTYKVKALINFKDIEDNKHREAGEIFECSKTRADYLLDHKAIEIIEEVKNENVVEEKKQKNDNIKKNKKNEDSKKNLSEDTKKEK